MEIMTSWERKGRAEGLVKGRAEGLVTGQRLLVERLLIRKLGTLPEELHAQVDQLSLSQLTALGEALLEFTTLDDLQIWLASPPLPR